MSEAVVTNGVSPAFLPAYRVSGSGPLLICISGMDGTGEMFFKQTPDLSRQFRVVTFRTRDYGSFTYEDLASDVANLIRGLGERRAIVLGESFGGTVALNVALQYPDMVERLIVINSFPRFRGRLRIRLAKLLASSGIFSILFPVRLGVNRLGLHLDGVGREDRKRFFCAIKTVQHAGYKQRLHLVSELNVEERLSEIHARTLFIAAEKDRLINSAPEAHAMAARMLNAEVRVIPGAGHVCLLGNRVNLAEIVADWCSHTA